MAYVFFILWKIQRIILIYKRTAAQVWRQRPGLLLAFITRASPGGPKTFLNVL
jgi:hypothetical protein